MKKGILLITTAFAATAALISCGDVKQDAKLVATESNQTPNTKVVQVVSQARIEPEAKVAKLSASSRGIVARVLKNENDIIQKGDLIVVLEHETELARLSQVKNKYQSQLARVESAKFEVAEFASKANNKNKELLRMKSLLAKGAETQQKVDDVETELEVLQACWQKAKSNLDVNRAELFQIQSEIDLVTAELNQKFVKAPSNGMLLSMDAVPGSLIEPQISFADFAPAGNLIARAEVDELFANQVKVGQPARIRVVGSDQILANGTVVFTSSFLKRKSLFSEEAGDQEDRRVREVKILFDNNTNLLVNTRVECIIDTK